MQKQGFYTNHLSDRTTVIITDKYFYKGWTKIGSYIPEDQGLLISEAGYYQGNFVDGRAHGRGKFTDLSGKISFEGTWSNGELK